MRKGNTTMVISGLLNLVTLITTVELLQQLNEVMLCMVLPWGWYTVSTPVLLAEGVFTVSVIKFKITKY